MKQLRRSRGDLSALKDHPALLEARKRIRAAQKAEKFDAYVAANTISSPIPPEPFLTMRQAMQDTRASAPTWVAKACENAHYSARTYPSADAKLGRLSATLSRSLKK